MKEEVVSSFSFVSCGFSGSRMEKIEKAKRDNGAFFVSGNGHCLVWFWLQSTEFSCCLMLSEGGDANKQHRLLSSPWATSVGTKKG